MRMLLKNSLCLYRKRLQKDMAVTESYVMNAVRVVVRGFAYLWMTQ